MLDTFWGANSSWFWMMIESLAVLIGIPLLYHQIKLHRQGNMMQTVSEIDRKWRSSEFKSYRRETARKHLEKTLNLEGGPGELADFFEDMGLYLKRGVLDQGLLWEKYGYYIKGYWMIFQDAVREFRATARDDGWFDKFEFLDIEMKRTAIKCGVRYGVMSRNEIEAFARNEIQAAEAH